MHADLFVWPAVTTTVPFALYSKHVKLRLHYYRGIWDDSIISDISFDLAEVMGQTWSSGDEGGRWDELVPPATVLLFLAQRLCVVLGGWTVVTLTTTAEDLSSRKQFVVTN